jgi:serine protease Do
MVNILQRLNAEIATVVVRVRGSLVQIRSSRRGTGAGIVWRTDGRILTNAHVIRRHSPQVTLTDGRTFPARVLASDTDHDLALLSVDACDLPAIEPASDVPQPGQWVLALGHPWGVPGAATAGVVIATGVPPEMARLQRELIQVNLPLRPGHSGGPLVDAYGRLVGLNTMMAGPEVGLAVPLHTIMAFLQRTTA